MTAHDPARRSATWIFNHLRRGRVYRADTRRGQIVGEYLGMETPHGDWAILLRHGAGTDSIALDDVTAIDRAA